MRVRWIRRRFRGSIRVLFICWCLQMIKLYLFETTVKYYGQGHGMSIKCQIKHFLSRQRSIFRLKAYFFTGHNRTTCVSKTIHKKIMSGKTLYIYWYPGVLKSYNSEQCTRYMQPLWSLHSVVNISMQANR